MTQLHGAQGLGDEDAARPAQPRDGRISAMRNLALAGPPAWGEEARKFGREIQKNLGLKPMNDPLHAGDGAS